MNFLPETMTAVAISEPGGPDVLKAERRPVPKPGEHEILIEVEAAGVNRPDVAQRQGVYPPPKGASDLPGLEIAGRVVALGSGVSRYQIGDAVVALIAGGGYAEYAVADESIALPVPDGLSFVEAAGLPETFFTVWHNVFQRGGLKAGEIFLVHGGSSGIGTTAIQLAKAFGARVIATAGSAAKCDYCVELGAERAVNYREEDFVAAVQHATDGHGADVILDMIGGDYIDRNFQAAAPDGRIAQIAFLGGSKVEVDFVRLLVKRLTLTGSTMRPRSPAFKAAIAAELYRDVWPLIASGRVKSRVDSTFPLERAADAHRHIESSKHMGKIILTMNHKDR